MEKVSFGEILFISGMENYVVIQMENKRIITHSTIKSLLDKLPDGKFIQTHKSYIVAIDKVDLIDGNALRIKNYQVPISRSLRDTVIQMLLR